MKKVFTIAGFGGQGALSIGLFLAHAAMHEKKKVAYVPAYGAEMRGGTANCTVSISDRDISSPVDINPDIVVVMNHPSLDKFEPRVKPGGILIINESLVHRDPARDDIAAYVIPAQKLADEVGFPRGSNMVILGALLELTGIIDNRNIYDYLIATFKGRYLDKMPMNIAAIEAGMQFIIEERKQLEKQRA